MKRLFPLTVLVTSLLTMSSVALAQAPPDTAEPGAKTPAKPTKMAPKKAKVSPVPKADVVNPPAKPAKPTEPIDPRLLDEPPEGSAAEGQGAISADDFDLDTVMGLVRDEKVKDARELEEIINDDNGINNIDMDGDQVVDHVIVREIREGADIRFEFIAVPSSNPDVASRVVIGSMSFTEDRDTRQVQVVGEYDEEQVTVQREVVYVYTVPHPYYVVGPPNPFCMWVYGPGRPAYWVSYSPVYYHTHYRHPRRVYMARRNRYRRSHHVRPVRGTPRSDTYRTRSASRRGHARGRSRSRSRSVRRSRRTTAARTAGQTGSGRSSRATRSSRKKKKRRRSSAHRGRSSRRHRGRRHHR